MKKSTRDTIILHQFYKKLWSYDVWLQSYDSDKRKGYFGPTFAFSCPWRGGLKIKIKKINK